MLILWAIAGAARAEVEFAGYISVAGGTKFVLADAAQAKVSDWLAVGGRFDGYVLAAFDAKTETLTLTKDGLTTRLALKLGTIKPAPSMEDGPWDEATLAAEIEANRKWLAAINAELQDRPEAEVVIRQQELLALMTGRNSKAQLRSPLEEFIQLQSDLILFIQMRREDDENAIKTQARVAVLRKQLAAAKP